MKFREMRRKAQALSQEECAAVLARNSYGVLSVLGEGGYPYAVPVSYLYQEGKIYFHCAKAGHKLDALRACDKVSFCVVDQDRVVPLEYTTYFRSVILFGRARVVEDEGEVRRRLECLALKYAPEDTEEHRKAALNKDMPAALVVEIAAEHITGKEAKELARGRKSK